jgi:putative CocE/NonD family hydrolase
MNSSTSGRKSYSIEAECNLEATMRDGTVLRADVYRPADNQRFPTLLMRTPYNKQNENTVEIARKLAERGYVLVLQDVRGRYASDGEFRPGFYTAEHCDAEDGYDTVEWSAGLPWSSGPVGTIGSSYCGWTQWELAPTRPPHLVAMMPQCIAASLLDRELCGVLRAGRVIWWTINNLAVDAGRRLGIESAPRTREEAEQLWNDRDRVKWLWFLPLSEIPDEVMPGMGKLFRRWLKDHTTDFFGFQQKHSQVNVSALTTTGWYDQQIGAIKHFTGMTANGMTEQARVNQRLIVGPWTHTTSDWVSKVGDVDFGTEACRDYILTADQWFGYWLKGEKNDVEDWPPIQLFVMGANRWRAESEWPLARTVYTDYYFHSGGRANTPAGDGVLSPEPPTQEPPDQYDYDPRDPVMTLYTPGGQQAPLDQRALSDRRDILVYSTPPLENPIEVTGPVTVHLWAASSARDTDFVIKLMDVRPDGFVQELCHGIVRARYRNGFERPSLLTPNEACEFMITVNPTSNLFKRGHRIQVDVSSSDFPNFDRNHNTGGNDYFESTLLTARQTIFHDSTRSSRIILPVIPRD